MQVSKILLAVCATTVCAGFLSLQAQDTPAQAAARSALMNSLGQPATATPAAPKTQLPPPAPKAPTPPAAPVAPAAPVVAAPAAAPVVLASQPLDSEAQAACRAALLQAMGMPTESAPTAVAAPTPPPVKPVASSPAKAVAASTVGNESGYMPIVAPPLPISPIKQHELDALLAHYKADQISPEEYHKQRAIILAEP